MGSLRRSSTFLSDGTRDGLPRESVANRIIWRSTAELNGGRLSKKAGSGRSPFLFIEVNCVAHRVGVRRGANLGPVGNGLWKCGQRNRTVDHIPTAPATTRYMTGDSKTPHQRADQTPLETTVSRQS